MAKYSFELKMTIIKEYLAGLGGYQYLADKHQIKNWTQVRDWIQIYKEFGEKGLLRSQKSKNYSVQFKLDAIELYQTSEKSYREIANLLEINNPSLIVNWVRRFSEEGIEGLSRQKGRPSKMPKQSNNQDEKNLLSSQTDKERIKELEKQVRSLEIQNAFLKELRKLRKMEAQEQMKQSQESFVASEDIIN